MALNNYRTLGARDRANVVAFAIWRGDLDHLGVAAGVCAHVRLRLQRQAMDTLGAAALDISASVEAVGAGGDEPAPSTTLVR
ncbi:hypothetical protein [Streptomyces sp. NPDC001851]|uniref:hypothetical protein n=1 Tax=Streptomyces sp. NPDC001851 TaxID=3154529 RepID=UPI003317E4AE